MKRAFARLPGMTAIEWRPARAGGGSRMPVPGTRLKRRAALDLSVDEELVRGELRGDALAAPLRNDLAILVDHELKREQLTEKRFLSAGLRFGVFTAGRRRHLDALIEMSLARRDEGAVRPTVAGIAAVRRPAAGGEMPSREVLRALRLAEIGSLLP